MGSEEKEQYTNSPPEKVSTLSLDSAPTAEKVPPNHVLLYGTTAFVSLGALLFGYDQGVISTIIASDTWLQEFNYPDSAIIGAVVSLFDVGCLFGALSNAWTASHLGRAKAMAVTTCVVIVGVLIQTFAVHIAMMIVGRFILGFGVGALSGLVPLYQAEIAPAHIRGRLISIEQMILCFGEMIATWIDYGFSQLAPTLPIWWRIPLGIQVVPAIILVLGCFYILPSPRWLAEKDRWDECLDVLTRLHGTDAAQVEYAQIQETLKLERQTSVATYRQMFSRRYRKRTLIAMATAGLQQLTGTNSILYFAPTLFAKAGLGQQQSFLATGGVGIVLFVTSWIPIWTIDRWSRKGYFMVGSFVMMLAMIGIAVTQAMTEVHPNIVGNAGNVIVFWPYLFYTAFNITWGPLAWLVPNEIMDITMRAKGNALSTATLWLCNVGVAQFSPMIVAKINWGLYPIYAGINLISIFLIYFFWVESAGVPLEEMAALFESKARKDDSTA
ncbi:general substrate transporter [Umbelopsis sp. PMI_123]|nr:general substrate transporter [Umbelopsis sp. PMI_123]